jgi:metal-responsive CopG/Arc/MetJ family transcriptional regulator
MSGRMIVTTRLAEDGVDQIDALAEQEDRTRSDMIRILLKEAIEARSKAGRLPPAKKSAPKSS